MGLASKGVHHLTHRLHHVAATFTAFEAEGRSNSTNNEPLNLSHKPGAPKDELGYMKTKTNTCVTPVAEF